ncbi:MAG: glycine oxidase ThiO [Pseudomonadota bacterium]
MTGSVSDKSVDIAVIGGGIIGLAVARALAAAGADLALVDAGDAPAPATPAAAGMLAPSFEEGLGGEALYALSAASLKAWPGFADAMQEETGVDIDFRADGILGIAYDEAEGEALIRQGAMLRARGGRARLILGEEARRLEPALSAATVCAMEAPDDAQVDPRKTSIALRAAIENHGGALMNARVATAIEKNGAWSLALDIGETLTAHKLVVATGAAPDWPVEVVARPPIRPAKGEAFALDIAAGPELRRVIRAPGAYLCPKAGGRLVIGASEWEGRADAEVDDKAIQTLRARAEAAVPGLAGRAERERWAGLRPATPDGAPILGRDPRGPETLFLALGHYRNGVLLAPESATLLAAEILGEAREEALNAFRPDRFG